MENFYEPYNDENKFNPLGIINNFNVQVDQFLNKLNRRPVVIVNFEECKFMDSHGLSVLIRLNQRLASLEGELIVVIPNGRIRDLCSQVQIDRILKLYSPKEYLEYCLKNDL